ncbi:LSU ribosomal protein L9p [hydrothermal vent metagenome]|uniref:LSU ribosomal protein L9p n=1 Tax=hydrothermal vent metagenome TaxID=652676 RepID=A0A3B0S326_9ZZZZ
MEIILLERVRKLGQIGDTVTVKDGYARNFLLPQKKALRSNKTNRAYFETQRAQIETRNLEAKNEAETVSTKLDGVSAIIIRQAGESGNLYGSVSARDIAMALDEQDMKVNRTQVIMDHAIKYLGIYKVEIKLHAEVSAKIEINIARSVEEAEMQAKGLDAKTAEEELDVSVEDYFENEEDSEAAMAADTEDDAEEVVAEEASEEAPEEEKSE